MDHTSGMRCSTALHVACGSKFSVGDADYLITRPLSFTSRLSNVQQKLNAKSPSSKTKSTTWKVLCIGPFLVS